MRKLYHYPLCAYSRAIRIMLSEKSMDFETIYETPWNPSDDIYEFSPSGILPVLVDINGTSIYGPSAIREYLEDVYPETRLIPGNHSQKAEARKLSDWFNFEFARDVYNPIFTEKVIKRFSRNVDRTSNPASIREAISNFSLHLEYITWLVERRNWIAGKEFSVADITAASFISVLDYLGCVSWDIYDSAKEWYVRIKSRPSFRSILSDNLSQIPPSKDYSNLDF